MKFFGFTREFKTLKFGVGIYRYLRSQSANQLELIDSVVRNNSTVMSRINNELLWKKYFESELSKYRNIHKGEDCFLLGNGPSLNQVDLTLLNDFHTIGLNKIYLIFKKVKLNLSYHVAVNDLVIEQSIKEFQKLSCPSFLSLRTSRIPQGEKSIHYIRTVGGCDGFTTNLVNPIVEHGTVTCVALQLAYFMGFRNVFLIGVDHSFAQKGQPNAAQTLEEDDINHFDPNYFKGQKWNLADLESSEKGYKFSKVYFENDDRMIYDATPNGKLNVFPKISFEEAINMCEQKIRH